MQPCDSLKGGAGLMYSGGSMMMVMLLMMLLLFFGVFHRLFMLLFDHLLVVFDGLF